MKSFKQYLKQLEKEKQKTGIMPVMVHGRHATEKTGIMPVMVHGRHATEKTGIMPVMVHGRHATRKIIKENENTSFEDFVNSVNSEKRPLKEDLHNHYTSFLENHQDVTHVRGYSSASSALNKKLITQAEYKKAGVDSTHLNEYDEEKKNGLERILSEHPAPRDFDTYSGLGFDPRNIMNSENILESPAFMSSSIDPYIASGFASFHQDGKFSSSTSPNYDRNKPMEAHILKIPVKEGSKVGAFINGVSQYGDKTPEGKSGEDEFLHNRGGRYKVDPTPRIMSMGNVNYHIWDTQQI